MDGCGDVEAVVDSQGKWRPQRGVGLKWRASKWMVRDRVVTGHIKTAEVGLVFTRYKRLSQDKGWWFLCRPVAVLCYLSSSLFTT